MNVWQHVLTCNLTLRAVNGTSRVPHSQFHVNIPCLNAYLAWCLINSELWKCLLVNTFYFEQGQSPNRGLLSALWNFAKSRCQLDRQPLASTWCVWGWARRGAWRGRRWAAAAATRTAGSPGNTAISAIQTPGTPSSSAIKYSIHWKWEWENDVLWSTLHF